MKKYICLIPAVTLGISAMAAGAQNVYEISAPAKPMNIIENGLKMGGASPKGGNIKVNSYYMSVNDRPVVPVMGEFHYSRYPNEQWEEQILKMKAGGVTVIPTYVFWNIHEEKEGQFDWSGDRDIRHFIELCGKHGLDVIVRIGPFDHGEIRNGGFPDWLFTKPLDVRSDNPLYLHYVGLLYDQIADQLKGLYYKDGGPIIGIQIENEHQHSAATWCINYPGEPGDYTAATYDEEFTMVGVSVQDKQITTAERGNQHMRTLKKMAEDRGMITPIYTVTGWGNAAVLGNEAIPATAAYPYPVWGDVQSKSEFCTFKDLHQTPDYAPVRYDPTQFPSFCAEMGAGIQMTYDKRPVIDPRGAETLMLRSLGGGANGIGYYMYQGGQTPKMQSGTEYFNDILGGVPKISYDFQAPLGEFGLEKPSYRHLRLLHSFLSDFGDRLAPMEVVLPANAANMTPDNRDELRYAMRVKDDRGFMFLINFQDHDYDRHDLKDLVLNVNLASGNIRIPSQGTFDLPKDENLIMPFNFPMGGAELQYAIAQPLMKINDNGCDHYFFFVPDGVKPEYAFDKSTVKGKYMFRPTPGYQSTFSVTSKNGSKIKVTTLTREQAMNSMKVNGKLLVTDATVLQYSPNSVKLLQLNDPEFEYVTYPSKSGFKSRKTTVDEVHPQFSTDRVSSRRVAVNFKDDASAPQVHEYFLDIDYTGDVAMAFLDNELVADHFYHGVPWTIGLNRFRDLMNKEPISLYFRPLHWDAPFLNSIPKSAVPSFDKGNVLDIRNVSIIPQYQTEIRIEE